jgi:hypothetical protein
MWRCSNQISPERLYVQPIAVGIAPLKDFERMAERELILKRASASRPSGEWNDDDYDVLADGAVVGRIFKVNAAPV